VYAREIDGEVHTFGVSGKLIMNALVMYDHQTRTLWSQFLGEGVKGSLTGTKLEFIPVTQTRWSQWLELHPDTLALDKRGRYTYDAYTRYYTDNRAGIIGEARTDDRLGKKEFVLGVDLNGSTKAYPFNALAISPVVNDSFAGEQLLIFFDPSTDNSLVYDRNVAGQTLTFSLLEGGSGVQTMLVDQETGTKWMAFTGRAIEGALKGNTLERMPSHYSFWFAWNDFHPDTELYLG